MYYFPHRYFDECLYSIKARLLRDTLSTRSGYFESSNQVLKTFTASLDLPGHLEEFYENTRHIVSWNVESIIEDHTLYPFYYSFLTQTKRVIVLDAMRSNSRRSIHASAGIIASGIHRVSYPMFCSCCAVDDIQKYGEAYWHRVHQIPDIQICPLHNCFLHEYNPNLDELKGRKYFLLSNELVKSSETVRNSCDVLFEIGNTFKAILLKRSTFDINQLNYESILRNNGYYSNDHLKRANLVEAFARHFSKLKNPFLKSLSKKKIGWVGQMALHPRSIFNPVKQILFSNFLESSELFHLKAKVQHPFGEGPWICLNKASDHYFQAVVTDFDYHFEKTTNRTIGLFKCSCGMVYSKHFVKSKYSLESRIRIKSWGNLWMNKLNECIVAGLSLRSIGKILGVNASTILRVFNRKPQKSRIKYSKNLKRQEWKNVLQKASFHFQTAKKENRGLYSWLWRNDYDWLKALHFKNQTNDKKQLRLKLNWVDVDEKLSQEIHDVNKRLVTTNFQQRISKTVIGRIVSNGQYILKTDLKNLPKTKQTISIVEESYENFQLRRIGQAVEKMRREDLSITKSAILRKANISRPTQRILKYIESLF